MVKENWSSCCASSTLDSQSDFSGVSNPDSAKMANVIVDVIHKIPNVTETSSMLASNESKQANQWGEFVSKQNFIDMHFC